MEAWIKWLHTSAKKSDGKLCHSFPLEVERAVDTCSEDSDVWRRRLWCLTPTLRKADASAGRRLGVPTARRAEASEFWRRRLGCLTPYFRRLGGLTQTPRRSNADASVGRRLGRPMPRKSDSDASACRRLWSVTPTARKSHADAS
jgi:hypothetical protein